MLSNCGAGEDIESPLDSKKIKPVNPKGNQFWIFIGKTHAEAETPKPWPSDVKSWFTGKYPDAVKNWGQEKRERERMRCLDVIIDSMDIILSKLNKIVKDREA